MNKRDARSAELGDSISFSIVTLEGSLLSEAKTRTVRKITEKKQHYFFLDL